MGANDFSKKLKEVSGEKIPNQYIVVLKDNNLPANAVRSLANETRSQGAFVTHTYEYALKGFSMKIPNQVVLERVLKSACNLR